MHGVTLRAHSPIRHNVIHRPWAMWLVLCVLVLGTLAPTVSRALAWSASGPMQEVCTADGGVLGVEASPEAMQGGTANGQTPPPSLDHCPFCLQASDRSAAPPPHQTSLFLVSGANQLRTVRQAHFFCKDIHRAPPARGPPALA
ncbi:MAG: DUF2946 family protein [Rhodoferax sp.]|nr:DUF2946 family protein [Rhodoferax sp.]